jgi:hypothetical protein
MTSGGRTQDSAFESALKRAVATRVLTSFNDTARDGLHKPRGNQLPDDLSG